jgi:nucleoside 2-deoxyribosyltransferase
MLESTAVVDADYAVYDPQNQNSTERFSENGSTAKHLALVLNLSEARRMSGKRNGTPQDIAEHLASSEQAEAVVIKMGPQGALVWHGGRTSTVPAFKSKSVWKLGSGDVFAATFAAAWMSLRLEPVEAATLASKATAHYCEHRVFITLERLQGEVRAPIRPSLSVLSGYRPKVYLAGPFFDLSQVWMVEQARLNLSEVGLDVFSPFHDIGLGSARDVVEKDLVALDAADVVYAWVDGADTGTIFEVGYAVAKGKKDVAFSQRETEESLKMLEGSNCIICNDYTTSVYQTLWSGVET